jgi:GNAT superfamily N-acetyltransferase
MPHKIMDINIKDIKILEADFEDLKEILEIQKSAFLSEAEIYNDYTIEPLTQTIESIQSDFKNFVFLKAMYLGNIVGSVKARDTGEYCLVARLIVRPEFQNKGIGKKLMGEIEKKFPTAKKYLLYTGFKSIKNLKLYESLGYIKSEEFDDGENPGLKWIKLIKEKLKQ